MKNLIKYIKNLNKESGNSLAEFAVTTAMMATLATTAAPKFSGVGEGAKEKKTLSDIDKIITASNNFYNDQVSQAGRGRFPGQQRFNSTVPSQFTGGADVTSADHDYPDSAPDGDNQITAELKVKAWLAIGLSNEQLATYDFADEADNWASVFGTTTTDSKGNAIVPDDHGLSPDEDVDVSGESYEQWAQSGEFTEDHEGIGALEYLELFGGNPISSPFQDGHYIYLVIKGNGSGSESIAPILFVADLESPKDFWKKLQP
ncbi:MAG: hypothetical protein CMB78_00835 [Euryarchaeota archaeon]|nr:hypothetical protein [Euryarchaeota archaeon]|tara:strand:+ start:327 stop:1106 length:780 start_codon:yes stop_codon:yes gene_type:complete